MRICPICSKTSAMVMHRVKLRGKYNPTVKHRKQPNLQWVQVPVGLKRYKEYAGKRIKACTKCMKAIAKNK